MKRGADGDDEEVGEQGGEQVRGRGREADLDAVVAHLGDVVGQGRAGALDRVARPVLELAGDLPGGVGDLRGRDLLGRSRPAGTWCTVIDLALVVLIVPTASRIGHDPDGQDAPQPAPVLSRRLPLLGGPVPARGRVRLAGRLVRTLRAHGCHARRRPWSVVTASSFCRSSPPGPPAGGGPAGAGNVLAMTDTEPGGAAPGPPGPPARPPGPSRTATCPANGSSRRPPPRSPHPAGAAARPATWAPALWPSAPVAWPGCRARRPPHPRRRTTRRSPCCRPRPRWCPRAMSPSSIPRGSLRRRSARAGCGSSTPSSASWSARSAR